MLNGAQTLKGAFYHDGQPGAQSLTFFHAVGRREEVRSGEDSRLPNCSTSAPGNLLPVGCEDHGSPSSDDAHDGVPQHAACLRVHACGGLVLWGGRGQQAGLGASPSRLLHPAWLTPYEQLCSLAHNGQSATPVGKTWGTEALGLLLEGRRQTQRIKRNYDTHRPI